MYASGTWRGFWEQKAHGRQEMRAFELHFRAGRVTGQGVDLVGPFTMRGECGGDGRVRIVKQYLGKHRVTYVGAPDGEGCILGTWEVALTFAGETYRSTGPFLMRPELARPTGDEAIVTIRPRS